MSDPGFEADRLSLSIDRFLDRIETVVRGKHEEIKLVLTALLCHGHVLLEDVPGTAKTVLARAIAGAIEGASVARVQCTPDLQPTDITGLSIFNQRERDFEFRPGPIFAHVVLVDEINRAMPKTQAALLEAMAENQVTIDGVTRQLPQPFIVIATENPVEYEGTFPLPEAQLDRFMLRTALGYPTAEEEVRVVDEQLEMHPLLRIQPVLSLKEVQELTRAIPRVFVHPTLGEWIVDLVRATRELDFVAIGASVRGSIALNRGARAWALLDGRTYVTAEDIQHLFEPVVLHRMFYRPSFVSDARERGWRSVGAEVRDQCLARAPSPGLELDVDIQAIAPG
jgi:MoxR-like ATPase